MGTDTRSPLWRARVPFPLGIVYALQENQQRACLSRWMGVEIEISHVSNRLTRLDLFQTCRGAALAMDSLESRESVYCVSYFVRAIWNT